MALKKVAVKIIGAFNREIFVILIVLYTSRIENFRATKQQKCLIFSGSDLTSKNKKKFSNFCTFPENKGKCDLQNSAVQTLQCLN